ncbi:MAG TPA: RodZ domain-containing protein [Burkholderiales bacterium]|nr:RodZ domain-containing protein [Burkholderiales bacterium]
MGSELQAAREALGLSIADVAQQLKFAPRQLEALEQGRFDLLPGGTFARGMVRSYARLLKLEAEPLLERMNGRFQAPDADTLAARYSQPVPFSDNARRSTFVYLGLSLGILAIGGGVGYQWYREHSAPAQAQAKRQPQVAAAAKAPAASTPRPAQSAPRPQPQAQPKVVETSATVQVAAAAAPKPPEPVVEKAAPKVLTGGLNRLVITCEEEAWIEVKDANDRMLVSSLNPKGAERVVQSRGPLTLVIGNPANVRVVHNNKPVDLAPHTKLGVSRFTLQ